jgi:hypothetical protein
MNLKQDFSGAPNVLAHGGSTIKTLLKGMTFFMRQSRGIFKLTEDSENGTENVVKNSSDSEDPKMVSKNGDENISHKSGGNPISEVISSFKKFSTADDLITEKSSEKSDSSNPKKTETLNDHVPSNDVKDVNSNGRVEDEDHPFHFNDLFGQDNIASLKTKKDRIIKVAAILIGGLLILYGFVLISASVTKVADNVIFGEKAMLSTFLILLGVLIIVAAYAQRILNRTFLNKIHTELEVAEGRSESDDGHKKAVDENGNKVGKDNKDNIVGENKR